MTHEITRGQGPIPPCVDARWNDELVEAIEIIEQLCRDLDQAQDWPEGSPQAKTMRRAERFLQEPLSRASRRSAPARGAEGAGDAR